MPPETIQKILILRFSSLGDIVMATAVPRCLRKTFPKAQIDMMVREDFFDLIRHNPYLDGKKGFDRKEGRKEGVSGLWRLRKEINQENYDVIYDAHRSLRTLLLMPFLKARYKFYFKKHYLRRNLALLLKIPLIQGMPRFLERYLEPLKPLGVKYDHLGPEIFISSEERKRALCQLTLPEKGSLRRIAIIPSAQWPGKRWPHFRKLIEKIIQETSHQIVILGGRQDVFCSELAEGIPLNRCFNAQGIFSIAESGAVLETCDFTVANDTGLMHMADALKIPSVLFLGPTSGDLGCLPYDRRSIVLEKSLWCRPCSKNGQAPCIRSERFCLTRLSPDEAFHAVSLLGAKT